MTNQSIIVAIKQDNVIKSFQTISEEEFENTVYLKPKHKKKLNRFGMVIFTCKCNNQRYDYITINKQ